MEFLPLTIDGRRVHVGFWSRFLAGTVDGLILVPIALLYFLASTVNWWLSLAIVLPQTWFFAMYHVSFNAVLGGTPGKLLMGLRITCPDGSAIGWREAWLRSCVDVGIAFCHALLQIWILIQVGPSAFNALPWPRAAEPSGVVLIVLGVLLGLQYVWAFGELVTLLFNKRKRALHDLIGGTVVIYKAFAKDA
ncbi:MAG: RDD family protein [Rhodothermales bacterium]|nr:RDD family protein [Rhodothermales bacterium]MBO6780803.1 RDD family protein [Rhodothermales bacterium]